MASSFYRWERDPFFSAAEEVQDSADRMESAYRTWIHAMKDTSGTWKLEELRRGLQATLGTTKWQLEEFGRAVTSSYLHSNFIEDTKDRHRNFITAIENQIAQVESSVSESSVSHGKPSWSRLNEGERDELAMFLSGSSSTESKPSRKSNVEDHRMEKSEDVSRNAMNECSRSSSHLVEVDLSEGAADTVPGHRRTASASPEISSWKIMVSDEAPPRKIPSVSGFLNKMEFSVPQLKWPNNGYKKLRVTDVHQDADTVLPRSQNLTRGMNVCYEKSKSCLDGCDNYYEKHLYSWYGAIQRQIQRSQYQLQYSRPVQVCFSIVLLLCLLVFMALRGI